jgi:hypothetical protein
VGADVGREVLETLLARVMRLVAMDGDSPAGGLAETTLSMAEGVLLVDLLDSDGATQQKLADRLNIDRAGLAGSEAHWSLSNWSPSAGRSESPQPARPHQICRSLDD